jgi:hypothetical protein
LAWAAGFFDGEGCSFFKKPGRSTKGNVVVCISQKDRRVLDCFVEATGCGRVNGPYLHSGRPMHQLMVFGAPACQDLMVKLWPWLGEVKRDQFEAAMTTLRGQRDDWFRLRGDECRRGHSDWAMTPRGRVCRVCRSAVNRRYRQRRVEVA